MKLHLDCVCICSLDMTLDPWSATLARYLSSCEKITPFFSSLLLSPPFLKEITNMNHFLGRWLCVEVVSQKAAALHHPSSSVFSYLVVKINTGTHLSGQLVRHTTLHSTRQSIPPFILCSSRSPSQTPSQTHKPRFVTHKDVHPAPMAAHKHTETGHGWSVTPGDEKMETKN